MARTVYVPEIGRALRFSDGTTDQQITEYVRSKYAPAPAPAPTEAGIGALESGLYGFRSRSQAGLGKAIQALGWDDTANYLFEQSRANERLEKSYKPDIADVSQIQSASDAAKFASSTIGQSAAETATTAGAIYAGTLTGAAAGSVVPFVGTAAGGVIGGVIGFAISSLPSFVGGNLQEQVRENNVTLEEANGYSAGVGAIAQAPLEFIFDRMIARRLPGGGAALDIAKKGFLSEVAKTARNGLLAEGLTEPAQQAIQIAQANPEKLLEFGPEVQKELINAAAAGVLAGGVIGGAAGGVDSIFSGRAPKETPVQREISADYAVAAQRGALMKKYAEINSGVENLSAQNAIGTLKLGKVRVDPTPANGLKAPIERFQIIDGKGKSIAEFSDAVNATDAVNQYSKIAGKKINLMNIDTGSRVPTSVAPVAPVATDSSKIKPVLEPGTIDAKPKPPKMPKAMASAIKNANLAAKLQPIEAAEIPYDSSTWDDIKKTRTPLSGKSKIIDYGGRKMVVASVNGVKVPFYLSSGLAGKAKVPSGKWYPFFGIGSDGWINKTSQEEIANYYGDEDLRRVAQTLDATVGDIRDDQTIPRVGLSGNHISFINSGLEPSENNSSETLEKVTRNIKSTLDKVRANKPVPIPEESAVEPAPAPAVETPIGAVEQTELSAEPIGAIPEVAPQTIGVGPEADVELVPPIINEVEQQAVRKVIAERKQKVTEGVKAALAKYNLKDVDTKFVPAFVDAMGKTTTREGSEAVSEGKSIVTLATNIYDPNLTVEQMVDKVVDVLNHETIHSLFDLGILRTAEKRVLLQAVSTAKVPGKQYTYLDYAKRLYDGTKPGMEIYQNPEVVAEEAVAQMFRDWRKRKIVAPPNTPGLINRVIETLRHMFNSMRRNRYEDIFAKAESGKLGNREAFPVADGKTKFSMAPQVGSNEFKSWFSGSQLADENGEPIKLYTGTSKDTIFESFKDSDRGTWVTSNPNEASSYAEYNDSMGLKPGPGWTYTPVNNKSRVIPLYASVKNVLDLSTRELQDAFYKGNYIPTFGGSNGYQKEQAAVGRVAMRNGYDAVKWGPDVWAVFNPKKNLKSQFNPFTDKSIASPKFSMAPDLPELSVAPVYPYGQRVPQVTASDTDRVIESLEYGAMVTKIDEIFNAKIFSYIPDRYKPSQEAVTEFMQKWADKILPVGQMIDFVKQNGGTVTDALDTYQKAQLSVSITSENLGNREENLYKPVVDFIKENGISRGELGKYLYALHAGERNARIRAITEPKLDDNGNVIPFDPAFGSGLSDADAKDIIRSVEGGPKASQFARAEQMVRKIIDDTNQLRLDSGLSPDYETIPITIQTEDGRTVTLEPYKKYVPLRGFVEESALDGDIAEEFKARIGQGFKIKGREDMRAFGRTSEASSEDILPHILLQNQEAVVRSEKNKVGQSFLELIETNPEILKNYGVEIMTSKTKPMRKYVNSRGIVKTMVDPMYKNSNDVFVVKREGVEIPIKIDNRLLQKALIVSKSIDPATNGKFIQFLGKFNRIMAAANTVYNPEFALINFPRDLQQAMLNFSQYDIDGVKMKILKDAGPAAWNVWKILRDPKAQNDWSDVYAQFKADGGSTSGFYGAFSLEEQIRKLDRMSMDPSNSPTSRAKDAILWVGKYLEDYNGAFENAIRLSVYKNLLDVNVSRQKAAFIAKNITVNFDQRGEYGPLMNSLYLFYNASVQGTMTLLTAASRSKKVQKALAGLVFFGFMQDLINSSISQGGDDEEPLYDKIPDYKLENNIILMDPFGLTDKGYIAIPLAYGANSFVNFGRAMSRNIRGGYTTGEAASSIGWTFVDAFNPVGGTESFLNFIVPSSLDPVVALWGNMDYSGRRIYPEAFPGSIPKADSQTYFSSTSPAAISVAQFLNRATGGSEYIPGAISVSPDTLEYVYDYILGAAGATARRVVDTAMNDVPKVLQGDWSNIEMNNIPVFRKVYGNVSERMSFEDYFNKVNHVLMRGEELKYAIKEGDPARVKEVRAKFADELKIYPAVKALANRRNKIASELRKVRENTKMPPEQKRRRQDFLQKQIEEITKRVDQLYGKQIGSKYPGLFD